MPKLDLEGLSVEHMTSVLWAKMQFPRDDDRAFELMARDAARHLVAHSPPDGIVELPARALSALLAGPSMREIEKAGPFRIRRGFTAGMFLWAAYLYSQTGKLVTFDAAADVMARAAAADEYPNLAIRPSENKPQINKAWNEMKPAAHLWAALCAAEMDVNAGRMPRDLRTLALMLRLAASLLKWANGCMVPKEPSARKGTVPLIALSDAWELPEQIEPVALGPMVPPAFVVAAAREKRGRNLNR